MMTPMKFESRKTFILVFGVASVLVLLMSSQRSLAAYLSETKWPPTPIGNLAADAALWYIYAFAAFPIYRIASRFSLESTSKIHLSLIHLLLACLFALASITIQSAFLSLLFGDPFVKIFQMGFLQRLYMRITFYFLILIVCYAYISYQRHRNQELKTYSLESRVAFAQFQLLKSKLNPEFLFQTLRSIGKWIRKDLETADLLTARLGDFLRLSLESSYAHKVPLEQETQLVRSYLDIQKLEHPDMETMIQVHPDVMDALVTNGMLLQVVERIPPGARVEIRAVPEGGRLKISVSGLAKVPDNDAEGLDLRLENGVLVFFVPVAQEPWEEPQSEDSSATLGSLDELQRSVADQEARMNRSKHSLANRIFRVFGFWSMVAAYFFTREIIMRRIAGEPLNLLDNMKDYVSWYWWAIFTPVIFWLARKFPIRKDLPLHLLLAAVISVLMVVLYSSQRWMLGLEMSMKIFRQILLGYPYPFDMLTYMGIVGVYEGLGYHKKYLEEELRTAKLRGNLMEAQLYALKMQLHPHFLFNTLNSISELMHEDAEAAEQMLKRLEDFLRITFENAEIQEIPLQQELEFLRNYLDIQQVRFQNRLKVALDIDPQTMKDAVPNLILQPIVENAIRHGIAPRMEAGTIEIRASHKNGSLVLQVEDDGPGLSGVEYRQGLGITNTRMRLEHLYGKECRFQMMNNPYGGLLVSLQIPVRKELPGV
jgi:two-component system LytT family sensor kinase